MTETIKRFVREVAQFNDETLIITLSILVLILVILVGYWHYNKKKFHQLSHQIPASVLKNYLDSIIQNSTSLKSSLFRGGGLDIGEGIPSVVSIKDLPSGNVSIGGDSSEELNQKIAEIASLSQRVSDKDRQITELDNKLRDLQAASLNSGEGSSEEVKILQDEIQFLRDQLASAGSGSSDGGDNSALTTELASVTKERDELKERLMEYEIIEEDLANLKRLQQENDQLKKTIAASQSGSPAEVAPVEEPVTETIEVVSEVAEVEVPAETPVEAPVAEAEEDEDDLEAQMAAAISDSAPTEPVAESSSNDEPLETPVNEGEQKSAEELLSEFEKMLG